MNRKSLALIIAILILVQYSALPQELYPGTISLNPTEKVSLNKPEIAFLKKYDIYVLCLGLLIYKYDVLDKCSKDEIREGIARHKENNFFSLSGVDFDLDNIDYFNRKGFTRYYPFYIQGKPFVIRIFRTDEKYFQPDVEILYEGKVQDPPVTFQILEGVNTILNDCRIGPSSMPASSKAITSP